MIVQACLNGARPRDFHPRLPLDAAEMAREGAACVAAGAAELHIHPRDGDGRESLSAVDETIRAVRRACPGTLIGVSTGAWIEGDEHLTRMRIAAWRDLPDYASVNLSERDASGVIATLLRVGVGIEAGLASIKDTERLLALPERRRVFRLLIEVDEQDFAKAAVTIDGIVRMLDRAEVRRALLLHGFDSTMWPFVELAQQRGWSTRIGLEDGKHLPSGEVAADNAALVAEAVKIFRGR